MDFGLGPQYVAPNEIRKILVISLGTHVCLEIHPSAIGFFPCTQEPLNSATVNSVT